MKPPFSSPTLFTFPLFLLTVSFYYKGTVLKSSSHLIYVHFNRLTIGRPNNFYYIVNDGFYSVSPVPPRLETLEDRREGGGSSTVPLLRKGLITSILRKFLKLDLVRSAMLSKQESISDVLNQSTKIS